MEIGEVALTEPKNLLSVLQNPLLCVLYWPLLTSQIVFLLSKGLTCLCGDESCSVKHPGRWKQLANPFFLTAFLLWVVVCIKINYQERDHLSSPSFLFIVCATDIFLARSLMPCACPPNLGMKNCVDSWNWYILISEKEVIFGEWHGKQLSASLF